MPRHIDKNAVVLRAKALRRSPTLPESLLWQALKTRPGGFKFRRQHPLHYYIVDFYCASARLVIEINGENHLLGDRPHRDERRNVWMVAQGMRVIRFEATEVLKDPDAVVLAIVAEAGCPLPLHHAADGPPPHDGIVGRN